MNGGNGWSFADRRKFRDAASSFVASRAAERAYEKKLRSVADRVRTILKSSDPEKAGQALDEYAALIEPWARQSAASMLAGVDRKNRDAFLREAARQGLDMRRLLASDGTGAVVRERIAENVRLIQSIVTHARDQISELVTESMASGMRAEDLAKRIEHVGEVSKSRARVIAATEVSKAGTALTKARAEACGSEGYVWRTVRDGATRPSHRAMEGKFVRWDEPPVLDNMRGHAGEFPNCRCYPEPVLKRDDGTAYRSPLPTQEEEKVAGEQKVFGVWENAVPARKGEEWPEVVRHVPGETLYNAAKAHIPEGKLVGYALNRNSPRGKNKAAVFASALGLTQEHADILQEQILRGIRSGKYQAERHGTNEYGEGFKVILPITGTNGRTVDVVTIWQYDRKKGSINTVPKMTTTYVL